jgi:integrase
MTALQNQLTEYLDRHGTSARALSLRAGLNEKLVTNILSGSIVRPSGQTLDALGSAIGGDLAPLVAIPTAAPTLQDVINYLEAHVPEGCSGDYRDQIVATLRRLPGWVGKSDPADIPASKADLEALVGRYNAAALGIGAATFGVYVSHINRALDFYFARAAKVMINDVTGPHRELYEVLREDFDHRTGDGLRVGRDRRYKTDQFYEFSRFLAYLHVRDRALTEVDETDFVAFAEHLRANGSVRSATPQKAERAAKRCRKAWNDMVDDPDPAIRAAFGGRKVGKPFASRVDKFGVPADICAPILAEYDGRIAPWGRGELSRMGQTLDEFLAEIDARAPQHRGNDQPDPLAKYFDNVAAGERAERIETDGGFLTKGKDRWGEKTIATRRGYVISLVKALYADCGYHVTSFEQLLAPRCVDAAFQALAFYNPDHENSAYFETIGKLLMTLARHWQRADETTLKQLRKLLEQYRRDRFGVTPRNRDKVSQFTPERLEDFFRLPFRLTDRVERLGKARRRELKAAGVQQPSAAELVTDEMALLLEVAVAILILQLRPLRRVNLLGIDLERHLRRTARGHLQCIIPKGEVAKGGEDIHITFDEDSARLIELFRDRFRPVLQSGNPTRNTLLFGSRTTDAPLVGLPDRLVRVVRQEIGVSIHPHLFRHLVGWVWLRRDPRALRDVSILLGHRSMETTRKYYCDLDEEIAQQDWSNILGEYRRAAV